MDVDSSANIAFGGIGYASGTEVNLPMIGFYSSTIQRPLWIKYISPSFGSPSVTSIVSIALSSDGTKFAAVAIY
jgi:hypothetical protein